MIEGVVLRLRHLYPADEIHVTDRPLLKTTLWSREGIFKSGPCQVGAWSQHFLSQLPYFWRYSRPWSSVARKGALLATRFMNIKPAALYRDRVQVATFDDYCRPFDALHVVGGGNLTDVFEPELFQRSYLIRTFYEQAKPVVLTGQQLGPFRSSIFKTALCQALRQTCFVGLREPTTSLEICEEARLPPNRFEVMGDDSFGSHQDETARVDALLADFHLQSGRFLAWNVRIASYNATQRHYLDRIARLLEAVAKQLGMPVLLVPIALSPGGSDVDSGRQLQRKTHATTVHILDRDDLSPSLVKGILGRAFGAVGASYHFCTFALSHGVPTVCFYDGDYYAQKAKGLCGFWKDDRLALSLRDMDVQAATDSILRLFNDTAYREKLRQDAQQAIARWETIFDREVQKSFGASSIIPSTS